MENVSCLVEAHLALRKLEKEMDHIRCDLIDRCMRENSCESNDMNALKKNYYDMAQQVETKKHEFEELLTDLPAPDETESHYGDMVDNIDYDESSASHDALYPSSVDATSTIHHETPIGMEQHDCDEKKAESVHNSPVVQDEVESVASVEVSVPQEDETEDKEEYPALSGSRSVSTTPPPPRGSMICTKHVRGQTIRTVQNTGYKYGGKGFEVFTGKRNRCNPIYGSTLLFCQETCNQNKVELIHDLVQCGRFKPEMIERIQFKKSGYYRDYALVTVRGPLKIIKNKIRSLNKGKGRKVMHIFKRSSSVSSTSKKSNVLYVNNFDILRKDSHKRFTNLFLRKGELMKDIKMATDRNRDPFAMVHFRNLGDAQRCVEQGMSFGGKRLKISYSKF